MADPDETTTKACCRCGSIKTLDRFHRRKGAADGRVGACKRCRNKYGREKYAEDPGDRNKRSAAWRDANRERVRRRDRRYQRRMRQDPVFFQKTQARDAVRKALKRGDLAKTPCSICGASLATVSGRSTIQAHHHRGYDRRHWLDVVWLCLACHGQAERA